jgi:hypothetical protein
MKMKVAAILCQVGGVAGIFAAGFFGWDILSHEPAYIPTPGRVKCIQNLEQIGMALKVWAQEHDGKFPFSLSTNVGGTMESCAKDGEGFDSNAYLHFQAASNQLGFPTILVCPEDRSKLPASGFQTLAAGNVSYRLRSGIDWAPTNQPFATCPIHGYILCTFGNVRTTETAKDTGRVREIAVYWRYDAKFREGAEQVIVLGGASLLLVLVGSYLRRQVK